MPKEDIKLENLYSFGCRAYVLIPKELRPKKRKLAPNAEVGYLVGYVGFSSHIYKIYILGRRKVVIIRDIKFHKNY